MSTAVEPLLMLLAGAGAGIVGAVAGLASLVSYPALLATGMPPLSANVTNTVAVVLSGVGSTAASRHELTGQRARVWRYTAVGVAGGTAGAVLLLVTPPGAFALVVPWLVGSSSLLLVVQPRLRALRPRAVRDAHPLMLLAVFAISVYGGYFGAAAGVLMLAALVTGLAETLLRANAVKNVVLCAANGVAAVGFAVFGPVDWRIVLPLAAGFLVGGWFGPRIARKVPAGLLRAVIAAGGLALAVRLGFSNG